MNRLEEQAAALGQAGRSVGADIRALKGLMEIATGKLLNGRRPGEPRLNLLHQSLRVQPELIFRIIESEVVEHPAKAGEHFLLLGCGYILPAHRHTLDLSAVILERHL